MRVARFSVPGGDPSFGIVELSEDHGEHPETVAAISGDPLMGPVKYTGERHLLSEVRLLAPVIPRSKIVGVSNQYAASPNELAGDFPRVPALFFKPNTSVIGPDEVILRPTGVSELTVGAALAIVIGRIARKVPLDRVDEVVFGFTCANDVSAASIAGVEDGWAWAKGWDTFCPLGPWIITHLDAVEASDLTISASVDGVVRQDSTTAMMLRNVAQLVSVVSDFATLLPGDVILTGTPIGSGAVVSGQNVSVTIEGIGTLTNPVLDDNDDEWSAESE